MTNFISIEIPEEIKNQFRNDKISFVKELDSSIEEFEQLFENNKVVQIGKRMRVDWDKFSRINTTYTSMFDEFNKWLDFVLIELVKTIGVDITTQLERADMYSCLCYCDELSIILNEKIDNEVLINKAVELVIEEKKGIDDNPKLRDMCTLFINIGKGNITPEKLVDISYNNYINMVKKVDTQSKHI